MANELSVLVAKTGKIKNFPIVIIGTDYWRELIEFIGKMARLRMIGPKDVDLIFVTDSVDGAIERIRAKTGRSVRPYARATTAPTFALVRRTRVAARAGIALGVTQDARNHPGVARHHHCHTKYN